MHIQANINGVMDQCTLVNGKIIKSMEMACILGLMEENMKVSGKIIICTDKENIHGLMADHTTGNMIKIKKMVMEFMYGLNYN